MKRNKLLYCSALFLAPLLSAVANDAITSPREELPSSSPLRDEAFANLSDEFNIEIVTAKLKAENKARLSAASSLAEFTITKPNQDLMVAQIEDQAEAAASEETEKKQAAQVTGADGRSSTSISITISNT